MIINDDTVFDIIIGEGDDSYNIGRMFDGITVIGRDIGSSWTNTLGPGTDRYGSTHEKTQLESKTITIEFVKSLDPEQDSVWRELLFAAIDCPDGPRKLTFNDQPNRYYNALIDGNIGYTYDIGSRIGTGTLNFLIPDGQSHATYIKELTQYTDDDTIGKVNYEDDGSITVTLNNEGNIDCYPIIAVQNKVQNDYLGIASEFGVMEIGNKTDPSGMSVIENTSQQLLNIKSDDNSATTGWGQFVNSGDTRDKLVGDFLSIGGSLKYGTAGHPYFGTGLVINSYGNTDSWGNWYGGFKKYTFPEKINDVVLDINNFSMNLTTKFWESKFGQTGIISIVVLDKKNVPIFGYLIYKVDNKGDTAYARYSRNVNYPGDPIGDGQWKQMQFKANNNEPGQKPAGSGNVAFNSSKGQIQMAKEGAMLSWTYNGVKSTIFAPEVTNAKVGNVEIGIGCRKSKGPTGNAQVMIINSLEFVARNIDALKKAPNLYTAKSVNTIDMTNGNVYYTADPTSSTKTIQNEDLVNGSEAFAIPKGKHDLRIIPSSWAQEKWITNKPKVTVRWVENFG